MDSVKREPTPAVILPDTHEGLTICTYPNVKEAGTRKGFYPSQRAALLLSAGSPDYNPVPRMSYPCSRTAGENL